MSDLSNEQITDLIDALYKETGKECKYVTYCSKCKKEMEPTLITKNCKGWPQAYHPECKKELILTPEKIHELVKSFPFVKKDN